jgi:hypothetical protein
MKIFVAGATGAVGLHLVRALCTLGHQVTGMTRAGPGVDRLRELGASASAADAFDPKVVRDAIEAAAPDAAIDQLTWPRRCRNSQRTPPAHTSTRAAHARWDGTKCPRAAARYANLRADFAPEETPELTPYLGRFRSSETPTAFSD